ncbi:MAG: malectin domain-containing carbohydrate-binding protein, partial [Patescibacteria group bacterium]|nr:malectin domain-containing carbohydrate-binding protein [Patescibacteria group bacterium]
SDGTVYGWAKDPDSENQAIVVHLYFDGQPGSNVSPIGVTAGDYRSDIGNHAFNFSIPDSYKDGKVHTVYAYGIDLNDATGNSNVMLSGSPKTFTLSAAPAVVSCPSPAANAFTGCYYYDQNLSTAVLTRTDSTVSFNWSAGGPGFPVPSDHFSARWQGNFFFENASYEFKVTADDGIRVYVDNNLILDKWIDQSASTYKIAKVLTAGSHLIKVEYYENAGDAVAAVSWAKQAAPDTSVPTVSISSPADNAMVSGIITVLAAAFDNVAISSVQFKADNINLGLEDMASPYITFLDTAALANGPHTLTATAKDSSGNTASATINIIVNNPVPDTYRVNSGGLAYIDKSGKQWSADAKYTGGNTYQVTSAMASTEDDSLYQNERFGNFSYVFPVSNGSYRVTLKFTELYWNYANARKFNVSINNTQVLSNFDIFAQAGGKNIALDKSFTVNVTNGQVVIQFTTLVDNAAVVAVEVVKSSSDIDAVPPSVPAGLSAAAVSSSQINLSWNASTDNAGVAGYLVYRNGFQIATTTDTSYSNTGLAPSAVYSFTVAAYDASGNVSAQPSSVSAVTQAAVIAPSLLVIQNGDFENGTTGWNYYNNGSGSFNTTAGYQGQSASLAIASAGNNNQLYQAGMTLKPNTSYRLTFMAKSSIGDDMSASLFQHVFPYVNYGLSGKSFDLTNAWQNFSVDFTTANFSNTVSDARISFILNGYAQDREVYQIDNVTLVPVAVDAVPPTVNFTSPPNNATISGTATLSVSALDNVAVAGVQFKMDESDYGSEDTSAPYATSLDTTALANGVHIITATARDASNNQASATVNILVSNTVSANSLIRLNAGSAAYTDPSGYKWEGDKNYSGGYNYYNNLPIANTESDPLYQSQRYGNFSYALDVPNGSYNVTLKFAEIYWNYANARKFNVSINNTQVLSNFDIFAASGGKNIAIDKTFPVTVMDGKVNIQFITVLDNALVSAVEITPL